jgi:hypothetical protein
MTLLRTKDQLISPPTQALAIRAWATLRIQVLRKVSMPFGDAHQRIAISHPILQAVQQDQGIAPCNSDAKAFF